MKLLSCKQASHLISKSLDSRLSWRDRIRLRFHLMICEACKRFSQQLIMLRLTVRKFVSGIENNQELGLSKEASERILKAMHYDDSNA